MVPLLNAMKKHIVALIFLILGTGSSAYGWTLEEAWDKYVPAAQNVQTAGPRATVYPGKLMGQASPEREAVFQSHWAQRANTYELHYEDPVPLARSVYGLALHARDVDETLPQEKFVQGVLGYHYGIAQVCAWANAILNNQYRAKLDENVLLGILLMDKVLLLEQGRFVAGTTAKHILAAAPGKKRTFNNNLRHERLHVLWDEDSTFKTAMLQQWEALSEQQKNEAKTVLYKFAKDNEGQIIEEWAIKEAEKQNVLR